MSDQQAEPRGPQLSISAEMSAGQYSNFVSIVHNFSELVLDFGRSLPGRQDIPVVARVIMTPFQAKQLLKALGQNLQGYERTFGPIPEPRIPGGGDTN